MALEYSMNIFEFKLCSNSNIINIHTHMSNTSLNSNNITYDHSKSLETTSIALIICIVLGCAVGCIVQTCRRR